jgi:hypothetical protein
LDYKLIPRNKNGMYVKWAGGRRKAYTREHFIDNCLRHTNEIDFKVNCISTNEGDMSWFAWAFYMQNRSLVEQKTDDKNRNCLVFQINENNHISFPVLRAGYLIWCFNAIRDMCQRSSGNVD